MCVCVGWGGGGANEVKRALRITAVGALDVT